MLDHPLQGIENWVQFFSGQDLPVLRQTVRRLEEARKDIDRIGGRELANIVLQDPLMAIRVIQYIQPIRGKRLSADITNIGNAIMMMGIEPFFNKFESLLTIESTLKDEPQAMLGLLQVIRRVQRASHYAHDWAFDRHDLNIEEVTLAALLHDLAEILLWCFAPKLAIAIRDKQKADKTLRSAAVQEEVLGTRLFDIQLGLCDAWQLPDLLKTLMDDANAEIPRVKNVTLAVNLARHSALGWDDAALHDDFSAIEKLLRIQRETLLNRIDLPPDDIARFLAMQQADPDAANPQT